MSLRTQKLHISGSLNGEAVFLVLLMDFHQSKDDVSTKWKKESEVAQSCPTLCDPMPARFRRS